MMSQSTPFPSALNTLTITLAANVQLVPTVAYCSKRATFAVPPEQYGLSTADNVCLFGINAGT